MKKKDKKKNPQQLKQEEIHQKNLYLKRIKAMMGIVGSESAYECLGSMGVEMLYLFRVRPVKLITHDTSALKVSKNDLTFLNDQLNRQLRNLFVTIGPEKKQVSVYDFYAYIETLQMVWRNVHKGNCLHPEAFKEKLPAFNGTYEKIRVDILIMLEDYLAMLSWLYSDMTHHIIRVEQAPIKDTNSLSDKSAFFNNYIVRFEKPAYELFEIDGHKRPIYQLASYRMEKCVKIVLTPQQLGMKGILQQLPLKVYIQMHALERIKERLGSFFMNVSYMEIFNSILALETFPSEDGGFLFLYGHSNKRLGYLKAKVMGDKIIIRTFLFLTNNGTPEGKKLATLLGVQKADKKYLGIDKLSTFINSDIESNENLKRIFCQAGCGSLFEMKNFMEKKPDHIIPCADYITRYLGLIKEEVAVNSEVLDTYS